MLFSDVDDSIDLTLSDKLEVAQKFWNLVAKQYNADVYFVNAGMDAWAADSLIYEIGVKRQCENCVLILTTNGGSVAASYRMVRAIRHFYNQGKFTLMALGYCKSAGTMVAWGADAIVMGHFGEFGPLDVQQMKDSNFWYESGLSTVECIKRLNRELYLCYKENFSVLKRNMGAKAASDIASNLSIGLFSPISGQIDPIQFVASQRAIDIAFDYAARLIKARKEPPYMGQKYYDCINKLVLGYPDHGFVIDYREAVDLFLGVEVQLLPTSDEYEMFEMDCYHLWRWQNSQEDEYIATHVASFNTGKEKSGGPSKRGGKRDKKH